MTAIENSTLIHFQKGIQLEVDEPFSQILQKNVMKSLSFEALH